MKKVAICNFEELIGEEDAISVATMLKLEKIRKNNFKLIIYSEKSIDDLLYYNRDFPFIDYIVHEKGYYLYDVNKNKRIIDKKLSKQIVNKIIKLFPKSNLKLFEDNNSIYEIQINNYNNELGDSVYIRKDNNKSIITKEKLSYKNIINEFCINNNIKKENIVQLTTRNRLGNNKETMNLDDLY